MAVSSTGSTFLTMALMVGRAIGNSMLTRE